MRQLEIFLAAAEDCHFVRTANRLGISQAAVSSQIASLETQLGKRLFVRRRGTKPVLSTHGLALLRETRSFFAEADKIRGFGAKTDQQRVVVRVCAGGHLLDDCIKPTLPEFYLRYSRLDLDCRRVDTLRQGVQLVQDGSMDLLVFTVSNPDEFPLHAEVLRPVRFGLYASPAFAARRHASAAELATLPFILPTEGSAAARMVQAALLQAGIVCSNVVARAQFAEVITAMARQGHGIAALFETMVGPDDGLIKFDVELPTLYRTLFRTRRPPSRAVRTASAFLRQALAR
ncbi:MAG TPA: LysR family transcriptional regulator [Gammaproteobacteria bacterium]